MFKASIYLITAAEAERQDMEIWDIIAQMIYKFKEKYNTKIKNVYTSSGGSELICVSFENEFDLSFSKNSKYFCHLEYEHKNIDEFTEKYTFCEEMTDEMFKVEGERQSC